MENYTEFKGLMEEYNTLLDGLLSTETDKLKIIASEDISALEQCMRSEEADILRIRGLDNRRDKLLEEAGMKGMTFTQIIESTTDAVQKNELQPLCVRMKQKTDSIKELSKNARAMIESKLDKADVILQNAGNYGSYGSDGRRTGAGGLSGLRTTTV